MKRSLRNLPERLLASVNYDAPNGNEHERAVCASQMREAAEAILALLSISDDLSRTLNLYVKRIDIANAEGDDVCSAFQEQAKALLTRRASL